MPKTKPRAPSTRALGQKIAEYLDKPLALLCARYWYRGIVDEVGEDFVVLRDPRAVEVSGPADGEAPLNEDQVPSEMIISLWAVEMISQPAWVAHGLKDPSIKVVRAEE